MKSPDLPYFYTPDISTTGQLSAEESAHCVRVLRMVAGDHLVVTDGVGHLYEAEIISTDPKATALHLLGELAPVEPTLSVFHLAIAPTKSIDRIEWLLEKGTEIGLAHLHLICTDRTIRRKVNLDRLEKITISAMKQSHKRVKPLISWYPHLSDFLTSPHLPQQRFIAYCGETHPKSDIHQAGLITADTVYMVGPEGDFTPQEVESALAHHFRPITLGEFRLRTETAGLYLATLHHIRSLEVLSSL